MPTQPLGGGSRCPFPTWPLLPQRASETIPHQGHDNRLYLIAIPHQAGQMACMWANTVGNVRDEGSGLPQHGSGLARQWRWTVHPGAYLP